MQNFFYFDRNNQKQGPVTEEQLQELANQGLITPNTRMETDTGYKGVAEQIPGLTFAAAPPNPFSKPITTPPSPAASFSSILGKMFGSPHPQTVGSSASPAPLSPLEQRKQAITYWTKLYSIAYAVYMFTAAFIYICRILTLQSALNDYDPLAFDNLMKTMDGFTALSVILGIPTGIFLAVTFCFFVVRIWEEVPREFARATPERAAGFSFIPLYNLYWWFQCFLGLFQDMNKATEHYGKGTRFSTAFIKGACIYWVAAAVISVLLGDRRYDLHVLLAFVNMGVTIPVLWYVRQQVLNFIDMKTEAGVG